MSDKNAVRLAMLIALTLPISLPLLIIYMIGRPLILGKVD